MPRPSRLSLEVLETFVALAENDGEGKDVPMKVKSRPS
jgi:hypothetical protein